MPAAAKTAPLPEPIAPFAPSTTTFWSALAMLSMCGETTLHVNL
jgi:hypothetical protein